MFSCTVLSPFRRDFYQWSFQGEPSMHYSKMANQTSNREGTINMNVQTPGQKVGPTIRARNQIALVLL